jgi:hypothetical protein
VLFIGRAQEKTCCSAPNATATPTGAMLEICG